MTTPKGAQDIGNTMYLFKSKTNSSDLIITAHGGYISDNSSFKVPDGLTILFYANHGEVLIDPGIGELSKKLSKAISVEEIKGGDLCKNYYLSKYQGKHAGDDGKTEVETYQSVARAVDNRDYHRKAKLDALLKNQGSLDDVMSDWGTSALTIRNRSIFIAGPRTKLFGVKLSEAVHNVRKALPALKYVHCSFCRSDMRKDNHAEGRVGFRA